MIGRTHDTLITAIDVGTTKICVLVAQMGIDGSLAIVGMGHAPSAGLARGVVVTIAPAVAALRAAIREAELTSGSAIVGAHIGISGAHIQSFQSHGMVPIRHGTVRDRDIQQVLAAARAITIPDGQQILHVMPSTYVIDGHEMVRDPHGLAGVRLEAHVQIITGAIASVQNLIRCCELAGVRVESVILEPIASAAAVLSNDERELGVGILDIGGGTSDFALYQRNGIRHTKIFPIAGAVFTNDIAVCLKVSLQDAERVKKEFGAVSHSDLPGMAPIMVTDVDGIEQRAIEPDDVCAVLEARAIELLCMVEREIEHHRLRSYMHAGLVITGGGALLRGIRELAIKRIRLPVRIGRPKIAEHTYALLQHPGYATSYGLLVHVMQQRLAGKEFHGQNAFKRLMSQMKSWISESF